MVPHFKPQQNTQLGIKTACRKLIVVAIPFAFCVGTSACYRSVRTTQDVTNNPNVYVAATRPTSECGAEIFAARLDTTFVRTNPAAQTYGAHLITISQPDYTKASRASRGKTAMLKLQVDENGDVIARSIRVTGIDDGDFEKELRNVARSFRYFPAVKNGCAVPTWSVAQYTVGGMMPTSSP